MVPKLSRSPGPPWKFALRPLHPTVVFCLSHGFSFLLLTRNAGALQNSTPLRPQGEKLKWRQYTFVIISLFGNPAANLVNSFRHYDAWWAIHMSTRQLNNFRNKFCSTNEILWWGENQSRTYWSDSWVWLHFLFERPIGRWYFFCAPYFNFICVHRDQSFVSIFSWWTLTPISSLSVTLLSG